MVKTRAVRRDEPMPNAQIAWGRQRDRLDLIRTHRITMTVLGNGSIRCDDALNGSVECNLDALDLQQIKQALRPDLAATAGVGEPAFATDPAQVFCVSPKKTDWVFPCFFASYNA